MQRLSLQPSHLKPLASPVHIQRATFNLQPATCNLPTWNLSSLASHLLPAHPFIDRNRLLGCTMPGEERSAFDPSGAQGGAQ